MVIAEEAGDSGVGELDATRLVETLSIGGNAGGVAEESDVEGAAEHTFIGAKPLETFFGGDLQSLVGDGTLGGPEAYGLRAENALVIFLGAT
jgi:hypothetical protein